MGRTMCLPRVVMQVLFINFIVYLKFFSLKFREIPNPTYVFLFICIWYVCLQSMYMSMCMFIMYACVCMCLECMCLSLCERERDTHKDRQIGIQTYRQSIFSEISNIHVMIHMWDLEEHEILVMVLHHFETGSRSIV